MFERVSQGQGAIPPEPPRRPSLQYAPGAGFKSNYGPGPTPLSFSFLEVGGPKSSTTNSKVGKDI